MQESRYPDPATPADSLKNNTVTTSGGTTTATTSGRQGVSENTSVQNMTPESLAALQGLINQLMSGGNNEILAERAKRSQTQQVIQALLGQVSSGQAFEESKGLMALNLQKAMEQNMPSIQRAIEGSGTSAGSMQALLAQKLASESALSASALGAEQAKAYAAQRSSLANTLEAATRPTNAATDALIKALGIAKGAVQNTQRNADSYSSSVTNTVTPDTTKTTVYDNNSGQPSDSGVAGPDSSAFDSPPNSYYTNLRNTGSKQSLYDYFTGRNSNGF